MARQQRDGREHYSTVPDFIWQADMRPWSKPLDVSIYAALCSFASGDPRSERFARCWPGMEAIGRKVPCSGRTVRRSLDRWEVHGWIYRSRAVRRANTVIVIVQVPEMVPVFATAQLGRATGDADLLDQAIQEHEARLEDLQTHGRHQTAADAVTRSRRRVLERTDLSPQPSPLTGQICPINSSVEGTTSSADPDSRGQLHRLDRTDLSPEQEKNQRTTQEQPHATEPVAGGEAAVQPVKDNDDPYGDDPEVKRWIAEARERMRWRTRQ